MKKTMFGAGFAVFVLFFGLAMLDAFQRRNWSKAGFWSVMAIVFLIGAKPAQFIRCLRARTSARRDGSGV